MSNILNKVLDESIVKHSKEDNESVASSVANMVAVGEILKEVI